MFRSVSSRYPSDNQSRSLTASNWQMHHDVNATEDWDGKYFRFIISIEFPHLPRYRWHSWTTSKNRSNAVNEIKEGFCMFFIYIFLVFSSQQSNPCVFSCGLQWLVCSWCFYLLISEQLHCRTLPCHRSMTRHSRSIRLITNNAMKHPLEFLDKLVSFIHSISFDMSS
jgi:hypothetical protein